MLARWCWLGQTDAVSFLLCLLLAASRGAIVEGRIGEPGGAPAAFAVVRLVQGEKTQLLRTGPDGRFRFRAFAGQAALTVTLPQGWTTTETLSRTFDPVLGGDVVRADFSASARRVLRGRLLIRGAPLPDTDIDAGQLGARTDARGGFVLDRLPAGPLELRVAAPPLRARIDVPPGAAELQRDVSVEVPDFFSLRLTPVPNGSAERPIADWLSARPLSRGEVSALEKLATLAALEPAFRLVMVANPRDAASGAQAAARLHRYLTGPALVPADRVVFAVGEFARVRHLQLVLTRLEETR